ncbi:MAG: c-type cytochrome [Thermosynechococcaceae cyanobacterium]
MTKMRLFLAALLFLTITTGIASPSLAAQSDGAALFETHCAGCHPQGKNILRRGKNLKLKALQKNEVDTVDAIATLVTHGKNNMSAYANTLSAPEIQAVSAYVLDQAQQGWH